MVAIQCAQSNKIHKRQPRYGLVQQGHTLYLLCRLYQFDDIRITALQRYADVEVLDEAVRPFPEFNIDDYLGDGAMYWPLPERQQIALKLRVSRRPACGSGRATSPVSRRSGTIKVGAKMKSGPGCTG